MVANVLKPAFWRIQSPGCVFVHYFPVLLGKSLRHDLSPLPLFDICHKQWVYFLPDRRLHDKVKRVASSAPWK